MEFHEKLIELVKRHEYLYNMKHPEYKHTEMKDQTWANIGRQLRQPANVCKVKWKSLRDSYKRVKQTIAQREEGNDPLDKRKKWKFEDKLKFLDDVVCTRSEADIVCCKVSEKILDKKYLRTMDLHHKLIELVKKHEYIYNMKHPEYKHVEMKDETWENIGRQLRQPAYVCKRRWKSLRDSYKRVRQTRLEGSDSADKRKKWKFEESLKFLDNFTCSRSMVFKTEEFYDDETDAAVNTINDQVAEEQFDVTIYNEPECSNEADFEIENFDLNDYVKKSDSTSKLANTSINTTINTGNKNDQEETRIKKKYDKEALIQEACQEMTNLLQNAKKHFTPPSSNQVFFNSIALQIEEAQLPAMTQMHLQQRILELVTLEIVNHQQNNIQHL